MNVQFHNTVTLEGMVTFLRFTHPEKEPRLIEVRLSGRFMLTRLLHSDEQLESLILRLRSGKNILIGSDIGNETLSAHSFIAQPYTIEPSSGGFITAIVPMRCDYAYASAVLEYIAECVGRLFREMLMIE